MSGGIMTRMQAEERVLVSRAQQEQEATRRREATASREEEHQRKMAELQERQEETKLSEELTAMRIAEASRRRHISIEMKEQIREDREEQRKWFWEQEHHRLLIIEKHRKVQMAIRAKEKNQDKLQHEYLCEARKFRIKRIFHFFDHDRDGVISLQDLSKRLRQLEKTFRKKDAQDMMEELWRHCQLFPGASKERQRVEKSDIDDYRGKLDKDAFFEMVLTCLEVQPVANTESQYQGMKTSEYYMPPLLVSIVEFLLHVEPCDLSVRSYDELEKELLSGKVTVEDGMTILFRRCGTPARVDLGNLLGFDRLVDPFAQFSFKDFLRAVLKTRNGEFMGENFFR
ncbi:hypothetical protein GUITHDRAFT_117978 [Guillardia theta CCMP2712]|uniref:EF-hand domain-containing protein n=1 Tax=Guillardia theta (strain CCMP2712) TaxID=905079 RepID=L1IJ47_GUITC|nr:hypothetical protein GUITHDRAFT_117978 [Guillardia theta CCMP2712]EKX35830.1 hypothetical protein GUITHDRAFT_117978 [Guillardia theta CCMP2712]|eukprot:XP_005822810.1 hypothetical protein GUITHDRAFT_117978 [Guillardia theta CCMP2712]